MSRRLIVGLVAAGLLGLGLAGPALAGTRHAVCVEDPHNPNADGWCVVWDDPTPIH